MADQLGGGAAATAARSAAQQAALRTSLGKFKRGERPDVSQLTDKKLRGELAAADTLVDKAALAAAKVRPLRSTPTGGSRPDATRRPGGAMAAACGGGRAGGGGHGAHVPVQPGADGAGG